MILIILILLIAIVFIANHFLKTKEKTTAKSITDEVTKEKIKKINK